MPVTIETSTGKRAHIEMSIPLVKGVKTKKAKPNLIPAGYDANVKISGDQYRVHEFRDRPGHTGGAVIEEIRADGTGAKIKLGPKYSVNAINMNIFRWKPK